MHKDTPEFREEIRYQFNRTFYKKDIHDFYVNAIISNLNEDDEDDEDEKEIVRGILLEIQSIEDIRNFSYLEITKTKYNEIALNCLIEKYNNKELLAEYCFFLMFEFLMENLNKITHEKDGEKSISKENMPRNFNDEELSFFKIGLDEITLFYQIVVENSVASKEEETDWDLDMINTSDKIFGSEAINFEKGLSIRESISKLYKMF